MSNTAQRIVEFLGDLHGMDRLQTHIGEKRDAVIDLQTAAIIEVHPDFLDGDCLMVEYAHGLKTAVHTCKLVEHLLVRNSTAMALTNPEGGTANEHYRHIAEHFSRKTGFGLQ